MRLLELFCHVDDFRQGFQPFWEQQMLDSGLRQRRRAARLCESEIMTILILFQQSRYRHFLAFDIEYVQVHLRR